MKSKQRTPLTRLEFTLSGSGVCQEREGGQVGVAEIHPEVGVLAPGVGVFWVQEGGVFTLVECPPRHHRIVNIKYNLNTNIIEIQLIYAMKVNHLSMN